MEEIPGTDVWNEALRLARGSLSEQEYTMWFKLRYLGLDGDTIVAGVPSSFHRDHFIRKYKTLMSDILGKVTGAPMEFSVVVSQGLAGAAIPAQAVVPTGSAVGTSAGPAGDASGGPSDGLSGGFAVGLSGSPAGGPAGSRPFTTGATDNAQQPGAGFRIGDGGGEASGTRPRPAATDPSRERWREAEPNGRTDASDRDRRHGNGRHPQLRPDYSFDRYVVGENNKLATNAAEAVAHDPGRVYNPYLIYGGVGLGKTHLMHAVGNSLHVIRPESRIICITAEEFTNEFIQTIHDRSTQAFKNKYRNVDLLLIDDIHFLQNKPGVQEELFHTFNALYDAEKQMVFTCDRPVSELKNLSDRLRSRFERGLNVDLQPPDYETRRAILKEKVGPNVTIVSDEVVDIIAKNVATNIRDLEAALTKLMAYAQLVQKEITPEIAKNLLKDMFGKFRHGSVTVDAVMRAVAEHYKLTFSDLKGKKRSKNIAFPRQVAMYIIRDITEYSTTEIGMEFGGRDHTTVMHSCQRIEERLKLDPTFDSTLQGLTRIAREYGVK